jgi:hypothetical protein
VEQKQNAEKKPTTKRIPRIVFDRPPFDLRRFLLCVAVGLLAAFALALLLSWVETISCKPVQAADAADAASGEVSYCDPVSDAGARFRFWSPFSSWSFFIPFMVVGLLAGATVGWAWKRGVTPRIEMIDMPVPTRRRRQWRPRVLTDLIKV